MKTVTGRVISAEPISLSKAATLLSGFASSDNGASQDVRAYLRRSSAAFNELKSIHREIKSKESKPSSDARRERNPAGEFEGGKIRLRKSETVSEKESIYGREQDGIKEDKKKKKKKEKSKKNEEEDVVDEKVNEKLEDEQRSEERKERKKRIKEEDVVDEKKKRRKSDEEMGSEERKSKKKRKSKEFDG